MPGFRLATVERLREQQEQVCARRLREATQELAQAWKHREELAEQLAASTSGPIPADQLVMAAMFRDRLRDDIRASSAEVERCSAMLGEARSAWMHAKAQLQAVQLLHERYRQEVRAGVARAEQREADEFAGTRSGSARRQMGGVS